MKVLKFKEPIVSKVAFKAIIRVVKSLVKGSDYFNVIDVIKEPLIYATDKKEVKEFLVQQYPQLFPAGKVYEKETKDQAQFFYVVIYPLSQWELDRQNSGSWTCAGCGQVHENLYLSRPRMFLYYGEDYKFCRSEEFENPCLELFKVKTNENGDEPVDNFKYVTKTSPTYIYKITEKASDKCYIGKTRNEPFFRWWSHLTHSRSPFGVYLRTTKISDWSFEVIEILDSSIPDSEVFKKESEYMALYDSIQNGFNQMVSSKK